MTTDFIEEALGLIADEDASPRPAFLKELRERFVAEALNGSASEAPRAPKARSRGWILAAALVSVVIAVVTIAFPRPRSASAVIAEARKRFAALQPLRVLVEHVTPAALLSSEVGEPVSGDWSLVTEISYLDERTWRREVVRDEHDPFAPTGTVGSFTVASGSELFLYDAVTRTSVTDPLPAWSPRTSRIQALQEITPTFEQAAPVLDEAVRDCRLAEGSELLGRPATHLRCAVQGETGDADVWLDETTGIVLSMSLPNGVHVEVRSLEEHPSFPDDAFATEADATPPSSGASGLPEAGVRIGDEAAPWVLPLVGGGELDLATLRGHPVLVFVWATWCGETCFGGDPATDALAATNDAYGDHSDELGVVTLAWADDAAAVTEVIEGAGLVVPTAVAADVDSDLPAALWGDLPGVPALVVLGADGSLMGLYVGDLQGEDVRSVAAAVLEGEGLPDLGGQTTQLLEG